jgi:hypothetical protein
MPKNKPDIEITGFSGMNNVKEKEGFTDANGVAEPRIILNADVDQTGRVSVRHGVTKVLTLTNAHSLWAGLTCCLFVDNERLYRYQSGAKIDISALYTGGLPLSYVEVGEKVYFSNRNCNGVFNSQSNIVQTWGVIPPRGPALLTVAGSLSPGLYNITMTNISSGEMSGAGAISSIELPLGGGIRVLGRPLGAVVWCTDANEATFYRIGETDQILSVPTVEPCPAMFCSPPPKLENLCYAFGRIWGSVEKTLYCSQPFNLGWFKLSSDRFEFESDITLIAKVATGLFVGMKDKTRFLDGTEPEKMQQMDAGAGSVQGTLAYCNNVPYLADIMGTQEKGYVDVPIWVTAEGIVVGNANGRLFNLTKNRLRFGIPERGSSLYRNQDGVFQFLSSFRQGTTGSGAGFSDAATCEVFRNGTLVPD